MSYKKFKRGFFAGVKIMSGTHPDSTINDMQLGQMVGVAFCFLFKWSLISCIFIGAQYLLNNLLGY